MGFLEVFGDVVGFILNAGQLDQQRFGAVAAGADGGDEGYAVFVRGAGFEQFAGDAAGQFEDFLGVAVVDRSIYYSKYQSQNR